MKMKSDCDCRIHKDGEIMHTYACPNQDQVYAEWKSDTISRRMKNIVQIWFCLTCEQKLVDGRFCGCEEE